MESFDHVNANSQELRSPPSPAFKVFPDRVTLQPAPSSRRTPFGNYKVDSSRRETEVSPSRRIAYCLGLTTVEFKASLTQEINELLDEIETTCHNEYTDPGQEQARSDVSAKLQIPSEDS